MGYDPAINATAKSTAWQSQHLPRVGQPAVPATAGVHAVPEHKEVPDAPAAGAAVADVGSKRGVRLP